MNKVDIAHELDEIAAAFRHLAEREDRGEQHLESFDSESSQTWDRLARVMEQRAPWE